MVKFGKKVKQTLKKNSEDDNRTGMEIVSSQSRQLGQKTLN